MKRMDRMMAIVMALQQRPETALSLADKLEVSKRTVLRDIQALSEIGVPISALPGPGGGYRLMDGYRLPPLQFDAGEALTVLLALDAMAKYSDSPFGQAKWTAADKIRSALPGPMLGQIAPLLRHVEMEVPDRRYKTPHLKALMSHAAEGRWLRVLYRSQNYRRHLTIRPKRVYAANGFWYCEAESLEHGEVRTFRVDRFEDIAETSPPLEIGTERGGKEGTGVKGDKDGDAKSAKDSEDGTPADGKDTVHLRVKLTYRGSLLAEQDPHFGHEVQQTSDEQWLLDCRLPASELNWAVSFFFSMGPDAEVIEPKELRLAIHERALALAKKYQ
ncbi:YafY family transcriptional regulator [Paenibacillus oralis]|uniref:YafY family transcriptional regulator n=1 Tax=Paenibacillus oralis TaxID=2490856 RepID=A0A3P3U361_9BACL|nr:YafY family protein [Paenibacillus oralis]RRJ64787.1 YafY family transcriptional regulator [Paenibacillus oralis]